MKEWIDDVKRGFTDNNGTIKLVKSIIGIFARVFICTSVYLIVMPLLTKAVINNSSTELSFETVFGIFAALGFVVVISLYMIRGFSLRVDKMSIGVLDFAVYIVSLQVMATAYEENVSLNSYLELVLTYLVLGVIFYFVYSRITIKNILANVEEDDGCIPHGVEYNEIALVLGHETSRKDMFKKYLRGITFFQTYSDDSFYKYETYYSMYEVVLGTKNIMRSLGNRKIKTGDELTIYIPDDYKKAEKYYYGVIKYLLNENANLWTLTFAGSDEEEVKKANGIVNLMKLSRKLITDEEQIVLQFEVKKVVNNEKDGK